MQHNNNGEMMDTKELKEHAEEGTYGPVRFNDAILALIARIAELEAAAGAPDLRSAVETAAKAMALSVGWEQWDTATDFTHTHSGNEPEDERDYFRGLAKVALASAAPVEALTDEEIDAMFNALDGKQLIAGENQMNWNRVIRNAFARAIEVRIKGGAK